MSIGAGSLSLKRFKLLQKPRDTQFAWVVKQLKKFSVQPVLDEDSREESLGWCHPFSGEPDFTDAQDWIYEGAFVFAMRKDHKKIPGTLMQLQYKAALASLTQKINLDGDKKISKKVKDALKERVKSELLHRTLPQIRLTEIVWQLDSNEIWVTAAGLSVVTDFEKLFAESFEMPLIGIHPGTLFVNFDRLQEGLAVDLQPIMDLAPVDFVQAASHGLQLADPAERKAASQSADEFF